MEISAAPPKIWDTLTAPPPGLNNAEQRFFIAFKFALPLGVIFHGLFIPLFWLLGYPELAAFNVFSFLAFCYGYWRIYRGDLKTALYLCLLFEVPLHAVLATAYLGFNVGFWLLVVTSVATVMICPFIPRVLRFVTSFLATVSVSLVAVYVLNTGSIYTPPSWLAYVFLPMNFVVLTSVVTVIIASYDVAVENAEAAQQREFERAENLLLNILPGPIATRLKAQEEPLADSLNAVTVLFCDIAGFTNMSRNLSAEALVTLLNDLFTRFDVLAAKHGAEKIKTIGDAYMIATGLDGAPDHAHRMVALAQEMQASFEDFRDAHQLDLGLRTGVHSGAAVAGVIGRQKFAYDLWGDTVNVASRMESTGIKDRIQISSQTRALLADTVPTEPRGLIEIKGHAARETHLLLPS